jgi:hypothetical protein
MKRGFWALPALLLPLLWASVSSDYASAKKKFDLIENDKLKPGSKVTLSSRELQAYVENELPQLAVPGIRNPKIDLGDGVASGSALIDFVKVRQAQGKPPSWLMSKLLGGERPVRVVTRIRSGSGRAEVDVEQVEVSGMTIQGKMLDYLIEHYLIPNYPTAKVGEPFELGHRIERLEVKPSVVGVVIGH